MENSPSRPPLRRGSEGLVRAQEAGLLQFLRLDGFSVLMRAMQSPVQKLKVKSAFLLQNLLLDHPEHKETLCSMGMVQQLVALIHSEHSSFHEHVLGALCSLVTDFPQGVWECREPQLGLEELLRARCQLLQDQEEFQKELEFCERHASRPHRRRAAWIGDIPHPPPAQQGSPLPSQHAAPSSCPFMAA